MSTEGNKALLEGIPLLKDAFVVLIKTEWNAIYTDELANGCVQILEAANIRYKVLSVPGAVELPFIVRAWQESNKPKADAFIVFGVVIKGATPHFDYVCKIVSEGITALNLRLPVPTVFGVLTVNTAQEALDRCGGSEGHKGKEAAITAMKMIHLNRQIG